MMMQRIYLPLLTYPYEAGETLIGNAVDLASNLSAPLFFTVIDISIPPIVNPWSVILDTDEMVREVKSQSTRTRQTYWWMFSARRKNGRKLLSSPPMNEPLEIRSSRRLSSCGPIFWSWAGMVTPGFVSSCSAARRRM